MVKDPVCGMQIDPKTANTPGRRSTSAQRIAWKSSTLTRTNMVIPRNTASTISTHN